MQNQRTVRYLPLQLRCISDYVAWCGRQSHKVFVGGLPQGTTEGQLVTFFEKVAGPVADALILKVSA